MNQRFKGFTLIELLTVVAVLGVLAAIAFPSMRDYMDKQRLVSQVRQISELAQLARAEAIKHSGVTDRAVSMTVSAPTPATWFVGLSNGDAACNSAATCVINQAGTDTTQFISGAAGAECTACTMTSHATAARIVFDLRGLATTTGSADQTITLRSPLGKELSVSVSRLGRISLCTPSGSVGGFPTC
jgi:type IV fimbrial biogenesis protein FimT